MDFLYIYILLLLLLLLRTLGSLKEIKYKFF